MQEATSISPRMTGSERRSGAELSPAAAAPEAAETVGEDENGVCVVIGVDRCSGGGEDGDCGEREGDSMCRICHLSSRSGEGGSELILLGCRCKGELGVAHRHCAEAWFVVKGNRCCEICGASANNVTVVIESSRVVEEGHARRESNTQLIPRDGGERIVCWRRLPVCNSLMAGLILAFLLLWFFREEEEEFAEADVLWPESDHPGGGGGGDDEKPAEPARPLIVCRKALSRPVRIPARREEPPRHRRRAPGAGLEGDDVSGDNGESVDMMVQLREKGRRLCDFRTAVLRLTGFIER